MKSKIALMLTGLVALLLPTGCTTTATTLGPVVAEVAQARIAMAILDKNPEAEPKLLAVAATLDALVQDTSGAEITEVAIRQFVASKAADWKLTAPEAELLTLGMLATRDRFLQSANVVSIRLGDPNVRVWIDAVRRGIAAGVAAHKR